MFKKLFSRMLSSTVGEVASEMRTRDPARWESELLERVKEMSANDPLIGAKIGGKELAQRLIETIKTESGVHTESLLCAAGALAGYSCQEASRAKNRAEGRKELSDFIEAKTDDGQVFYFGEMPNAFLAERKLSVWRLAAGGAQLNGCTSILDVREIFSHVAESVGREDFGVPRLPPGHPVHELPRTYLDQFWPRFFPMVERFCPEPDHRPALFGLAIQELLSQTRAILDPCLALKVVMESAVPMSKVDLSAR